MRVRSFGICLFVPFFLFGCATYAGRPVYGNAHLVTTQDLREAVAAVNRSYPSDKLCALRVIDADSIDYIYSQDERDYWSVVRRSNGKWQTTGSPVAFRDPIGNHLPGE
jgi:hypothetical protein